jgi:hypothetical protein
VGRKSIATKGVLGPKGYPKTLVHCSAHYKGKSKSLKQSSSSMNDKQTPSHSGFSIGNVHESFLKDINLELKEGIGGVYAKLKGGKPK